LAALPEIKALATSGETTAPATLSLDLAAACDCAMTEGTLLDVRGLTFDTDAAIHVRKGCSLILQGPATIVGRGHSIFQVSGRGRLELRCIRLDHRCEPLPAGTQVEKKIPGQGDVLHISSENDVSSVGACVFVTNKGSTFLDGCTLSSTHGLGVWLVQRAKCEIRSGCELGPVARSGVALFGQARATVSDTTIRQCAMHGACARGTGMLHISRCAIEDCGRRGAYAYQRASLTMEDCVVRGTSDPTRAAIEAAGCREGDAVVLSLRRCNLQANAGAPLRVTGAVETHMDRNMEEMACEGGGPGRADGDTDGAARGRIAAGAVAGEETRGAGTMQTYF
jgi:hypothetical protein